jgi:hypothetical protein
MGILDIVILGACIHMIDAEHRDHLLTMIAYYTTYKVDDPSRFVLFLQGLLFAPTRRFQSHQYELQSPGHDSNESTNECRHSTEYPCVSKLLIIHRYEYYKFPLVCL